MAESPMSDDSLSSIGASTEPLPASDGPFVSPPSGPAAQVRSPPPQSRKQLSGGNESDSTLTEQSSSEGRRDGEEDEEDDRGGEPTPKARPPKTSEGQVRRPIEDVTSDLSSAKEDSDEEVDTEPKTNALKQSTVSPPRRQVIGELNARRATSRPGSYSELDRDEDDSRQAEVDDDGLSSADGGDEDEVKRAGVAAKRGGKAARGARGRPKGSARGRGGKKAAPARREETTLTSDDEQEVKKDEDEAPLPAEAPVSPPKGKARGGKAARGAGRGGKSGGKGGKNAPTAVSAPKSRSRSAEREGSAPSETSDSQTVNTRKRPRESDPPNEASLPLEEMPDISSLPPLPALPDLPSTSTEQHTAEQDVTMEVKEETDDAQVKQGEGQSATEPMEVDQEEVEPELEVESEESSQVNKKKASKKGKKGGKGKEKAKDQDVEAEETGTPVGSDHEDAGDSDDAFLRKRAEAMEALTRIEIEFARLRDRLYVERMTEVEKERIGVEDGTHPELLHLIQLIEIRRTKKLELAKKWLDGLEGAYERHRDEAEHATWTWWANGRSDLQTSMLDEANSKRRKLEREKRKMDRPKDDGLTPLLAPRPLPPVPLQHQRRLGFDGEHLTEADIIWSLRHPDVRADASVSALDTDSAHSDLERMGLREPDRHPAGSYAFESLYSRQYGQAPYGDPRGLPPSFSYPSYDQSALSMAQHPFSAPFSNVAHAHPPAVASRPPSNPRSSAFPKEMGGTAPRVYNPSPFSNPYVETSSGPLHAPAWQKNVGGDEGRRQRTPSAPNGGLADSLDILASHKERGADVEVTKEVNGHNTLKARPSLDDHMAHARSPKAPPKVNGTDRASFLSIPVIPPFKGHSSSAVPSSASTVTAPVAAAASPNMHDATAPVAPPQPQASPLLGQVPLKTAPTLFGGSFVAGMETAPATKAA